MKSIREFFALERNTLVLFTAVLVLTLGEEMWSEFIPKFMQSLGAGVIAVGLYGTLRDLLDAVYQYPGGWLTDRLGHRRALLLFNALAGLGYVVLLLAPHWTFVLLGLPLVMAWSSFSLPATFELIGRSLRQDQRAMGFGVQSILKRVPIVVAPIAGGLLIQHFTIQPGVRLALGITVAAAAIAFALQSAGYRDSAAPVPHAESGLRAGWRGLHPGLKRLLVSDILARLAEGIPSAFVILFATDQLGASVAGFGGLLGLRSLASIVSYVPAARLADRYGRRPFVAITFFFFAFFPISLVIAPGAWWLPLAFVAAGLRELGEPARKAQITDLAREGRRGRDVGLYYLIRGLAVFPAAGIGGLLWRYAGPESVFWIAGAVGFVGLAWYVRLAGDARSAERRA